MLVISEMCLLSEASKDQLEVCLSGQEFVVRMPLFFWSDVSVVT